MDIKIATIKKASPAELAKFLSKTNRKGDRAVQVLSWTKLARIWERCPANSKARRMIKAEARKCGYGASIVLGMNR